MLIILAIFVSSALADSHEKYIDLLPENEKKEFLNKVARRILDTVEPTKNVDKSSTEITDDQLQQHNAFVEKILKEETVNIRPRRSRDTSSSEDDNNRSDSLEVKPLDSEREAQDNSDTVDKSSESENISLFAKEIKQQSNDDKMQESSTDQIKVEIVTENEVPVQKKISVTSDNGNKTDSKIESADKLEVIPVFTENVNSSPSTFLNSETQTTKKYNMTGEDENNRSESLNLERDTNDNNDNVEKYNETQTVSLSAIQTNRRSYNYTTLESSTDNLKGEMVTESVEPVQKKTIEYESGSRKPENDLHDKKSTEEVTVTKKQIKTENRNHTASTSFENEAKFNKSNKSAEKTTDETLVMKDNSYTLSNTSAESQTQTKINVSQTGDKTITNSTNVERISTKTDINLTKYPAINSIAPTERETQVTKNNLNTENTFEINTANVQKTTTNIDEYVEKYTTTKNEMAVNNTVTDTTKTDIFIDLDSYLKTTKSPLPKKKISHETNLETVDMATSTKLKLNRKPNTILKKKSKLKARLETDVVTTPKLPVLTTTPSTKLKIIKKPTIISKIKKISENTTIITYISGKPFKKHKSENDLTNVEKNSQKKYEEHKNIKPYEVYEIPWPESSGDPPFLRNPEPIQDQPHFIPVYKYSSNFAYYNPTNRRGPNAVEENPTEVYENLLRGGDKNRNNSATNEFTLHLNEELRKFGVIKNKRSRSRYTTTTPRPDCDYSEYTTTEDPDMVTSFPDSNEELHPINYMKKGLKTHIQAVRKILQKKFNHKPKQVDTELPAHIINEKKILEKYKNKNIRSPVLRVKSVNNNKIDIEDYFGKINRVNDKTKGFNHLQGANKQLSHNGKGVYIVKNVHENRFIQKQIKIKHNKLEPQKIETIENILSITDVTDLVTDLQRLQRLNLNLMRRNGDVKVDMYLKVLKNLIEQDSKALKQYDWLATTVHIHSALQKLLELIDKKTNLQPIHPADVQILKYVVFTYNFSLELKSSNLLKSQLKNRVRLIPMGNEKETEGLGEKGIKNRVMLYLRTQLPSFSTDDGLQSLKDFLIEVKDSLFDLHEAITNVAKITKFKKQNWYENIKDLYLTTDEKHLRELLLHLTFSRLVDLLENSCENGLEKEFVQYMKTHKKETKRTLEEMMFLLKILDDIKYNLE